MTVKVYSRDNCGPCRTLFYYLDKKGIRYEKLSTEGTDIRVVPTTIIGGETITGLNLRRISDLLFGTI